MDGVDPDRLPEVTCVREREHDTSDAAVSLPSLPALSK